MLLAIDTATQIMGIALHDGTNLIAEQTLRTGNQHSVLLAPTIEHILGICEADIAELTAVAVSIGPGSYTGLRIGVALAKGIASSQDLPLVGITTLDTLAAAHPGRSKHNLITCVPAGRGRVIAGAYAWRKNRWASLAEPENTQWADAFDMVEEPAFLTGEINQAGLDALQMANANGKKITLSPASFRLRRAGVLADVALQRIEDKGAESFSPEKVAPIYLKSKDPA